MRSAVLTSCLLAAATLGAETKSHPGAGDASLPPMFGGRIKHVVAIMFENRSFDHMLGYLRANRTDIDGCLPSLGDYCSNPVNPSYPNQDLIFVGSNALYIQPGDPDHSIPGTTSQLFGAGPTDIWPPPMNGFVYDYSTRDTLKNDNGTVIMQCFDPSSVPIITTLANEFGVFDRWFCDVPGPTDPNRLYSWMATSSGMGYNAEDRLIAGFIGPNIFQMLDETITFTNNTWRVYYEQAPSAIYVEYTRHHLRRFREMETFFVDLNSGDLPLFSWLDPAYFDMEEFPASDQHPDHDVTEGEKLMKRVYEALRQSPVWEDTLFLVFYDEHGGFFDHVPPPLAVNPDGREATDVTPPFNFTRYGIRIPAVLVSPYVVKGSVANRPDPSDSSQYSHSSLPHTMREQFSPSYPPYNDREEIALTFEGMVSLDYPRDDCPTKLPDVPNTENAWLKMNIKHGSQPVNEFQLNLANTIAPLCGASSETVTEHSKNQDMLGKFAMDCTKFFVHST